MISQFVPSSKQQPTLVNGGRFPPSPIRGLGHDRCDLGTVHAVSGSVSSKCESHVDDLKFLSY